VPDALVATDLDLATDIGRDLAPQVALDLEVRVDVIAQRDDVLVGQAAGTQVRADAGGRQGRLARVGPTP